MPGRVTLIGGAGLEVGAGLVSLGTTAASREAGEALLFPCDWLYMVYCENAVRQGFRHFAVRGAVNHSESFGRRGVGNELPRELD